MSYDVKKTDGTTLVEVPDNTINTSACSAALVGRGQTNYGLHIAQNFVRLTENWANETAPAAPLTGQFWFDLIAGIPKFYDGTDWQAVGTGSGGGSAELTIGSNTVSVFISNNFIVGVVSHTTVANGSLPVNAEIGGVNYTMRSRFPAGLLPGMNLATDSSEYMFRGTASSALYADLAERYETSEAVEIGDLVEIGGQKEIQKCREMLSTNVFGVISGNPAYRMNDGAGDDTTHPFVALAGRVPVKVIGIAKKGERLVASSFPGIAMAIPTNHIKNVFSVVGRVLFDKDDPGVSLVEAVVGTK